ncbi:hypothetical protein A2303_04170 [Candidatus Falkowbacteria bacterium RIFOXYB2_FULL_47_14]|uniref:Hydrolase TatD n=1 Tax=Candidatus Falkowbacteria bacterium RIFOXYA2_FULL_47_19 TaxID=1797994 RepID=A0A1F5SKR1_9BACT|nr:MAG: hypothetical protein A2227_04090 [Candidatus Falkowbacteria bacterium RIFOXYA2_FULL_47_19]OGF35368.1 MAG: hypothetical protein A2468_02260 [Candidatus Falkowbacteria bacterium RIFOXYC2_FULL_46_15]OGF43095.1 MAG: hypothetical protein A2303_04170 [Candidatus Falkowbacteria bacterium RIFOXYB2_FULL_47_14]
MHIDTHAHINFSAYREDGENIIRDSLHDNVWMVVVGADYKTSKRALDYANRYEKGVYAAVGLHPMHLFQFRAATEDYDFHTRGEEFNYGSYEKLASFPKVVAVGEIGLDYYHMDIGLDAREVKAAQRDVFWQQLLLARTLDIPALIHCRQAHDDMISILKDFRKEHRQLIPVDRPWAVMHCFSGDEDLAWQYFNLGLIISFTGIITFSRQWDDLIRKVPNNKFMIETDCPFLTPEPYRGERNLPVYVKYVAKRIAEIRKAETEKIAEMTTRTARDFFRI